MEELSEENLKFLSDSHLNDELIVPKTCKNKYPFKCILCQLKFSNMESAQTHFQYDHEKQNVLPKKPVKIQTSELGNPCDKKVNEKQKYVEIEEFPGKIQTSELGNPYGEQLYYQTRLLDGGAGGVTNHKLWALARPSLSSALPVIATTRACLALARSASSCSISSNSAVNARLSE